MVFRLELNKLIARAGMIVSAAALCIWLGFLVISHFIVGVLTDERVSLSRQVLAAGADYFPDSAKLQIRLAAMSLAETDGNDRVSEQAKASALRAISLSPFNATPRLLLAKSLELGGESAGAEDALRAAVSLAPTNTDLHWQFANLLIRRGKLDEARAEFRIAVAADRSLLAPALDLLWQVSGGGIRVLEDVTGGAPAARLGLAQFLLAQARPEDGVGIFGQIARQDKLSASLVVDTAAFIDKLMAAGDLELSRRLWLDVVSGQGGEGPLLWNGSFESDAPPGLSQFDWNLGRTEYALVRIDAGVGHSGDRSLRIDFTGRDTTRLTGEIQQLVLLRPGGHYRLECYAKASRLVTPEGPRLAVTARNSPQAVATSRPVVADVADWQLLAVDFAAPANQSAFSVSIQRTPRYSYDDPTRGTIWFDDFKLTERAPPSGSQKAVGQNER